jgi:hypothetical protein
MLIRRRRDGERGQMLAFAAAAFVTVLGGLLAAVADVLALANEGATAQATALVAAQAGGTAFEPLGGLQGALASSQQLPAGPRAEEQCRRAALVADPGAEVACTARLGVVTARVRRSVRLPLPLFGLFSTVDATAQGGPAFGTVRAR